MLSTSSAAKRSGQATPQKECRGTVTAFRNNVAGRCLASHPRHDIFWNQDLREERMYLHDLLPHQGLDYVLMVHHVLGSGYREITIVRKIKKCAIKFISNIFEDSSSFSINF